MYFQQTTEQSIHKYLLSAFLMSDIVLGVGDIEKINTIPAFEEFTFELSGSKHNLHLYENIQNIYITDIR